MTHQPGITDDVPALSRHLTFRLRPDVDPRGALARMRGLADGRSVVVGVGKATVGRLEASVQGLREAPALEGRGVSIPSTPAALFAWLRGTDRGELVHATIALTDALAEAFAPEATYDSFVHAGGRDLTGYEDGTENPTGDEALRAAFVSGRGPGLDGSSFVVVQAWVHDLRRFGAFAPSERDAIVGRRRSDNEELDDAPASAHVKRTAQEDFEPPAFVLRRSMPWADASAEGLVFVAFGRSFDAFEALARRMVGLDDGVTDALLRFTRPVSTGYFWCPPLRDGALDLRALGL